MRGTRKGRSQRVTRLAARQGRGKYGNIKTVVDGIVFDSIREAQRYQYLKLLEDAGDISNLRLQVKYELIPTQRETCTAVYTKGSKKGLQKLGRVLEKECSYIADFVYEENGETVVEDVKGRRTEVYNIKKKLMLYRYGIRVREV